MYSNIPALVGALIHPLDEFADRFGQTAPATRRRAAAKGWAGYLRLLDIVEAAEDALASLVSFGLEPQVVMRVHHIHTTGLKLSRLLARLAQLRSVIEGLGLPFDGAAGARLAVGVADLRSALQATRTPDSARFPDSQTVRAVPGRASPCPAAGVRHQRQAVGHRDRPSGWLA